MRSYTYSSLCLYILRTQHFLPKETHTVKSLLMIIMGETQKEVMWKKEEEEEAQVSMWKYIFGFSEMAVVRCAIDLKIADAIESQGSPMTLSQLSSTLGSDSSLLFRKVFKEIPTNHGSPSYAQTPLSRSLMRNGEQSMAALVLLNSSPVMLSPWLNLSSLLLSNGSTPFDKAHGKDLWSYSAANLGHSEIFDEAMASDTRLCVPMIIDRCAEAFEGVNTVVDVGGGNGTAMGVLVKACPWVKAISFDCPRVVCVAKTYDGVEHVGGDMFSNVPKADAVFLKWILHDWGDEECIKILRKCREAVPKENGRVIIVDAVIDEEENNEDRFKDGKLMLDMVMMAHTTTGKERTLKEWDYVIKEAGFSRYTVKSIHAMQSVIIVFP